MSPAASLEGARVLVTGATGFIGGRLARRLAAEEGARVTGAGRRLERSRRLEEHGLELARADLLDRERIRELVRGRDVVFHAAAWMGGDPAQAHRVNVEATEDLVRAAAETGVDRFVHVSSIAVYGRPETRIVDETHPLAPDARSAYGRTKTRGEIAAREAARAGDLELAVVRPAMVYGPRSRIWTLKIFRMACAGRPLLIGDGTGHFHPAYVDDVVDALVRCATSPAAAGEAFNVVDEPVTWREYVGHHAALCGREPRSIPVWLAKLVAAADRIPGLDLPLDGTRVAMATEPFVFPSRKARERLGWEPGVPLEEGLRRAEAWLREEGHL